MVAEAGQRAARETHTIRAVQNSRAKLIPKSPTRTQHTHPSRIPLPLLPGPTTPTSPKHTRHRRLPQHHRNRLRSRSISHKLDQGPVVRWPPRGTLRHPRPPRPAARGHGDCQRWPSDPALRRQRTAQILPAMARAAPALLLKAPPFRSSPHLLGPQRIAERVAR